MIETTEVRRAGLPRASPVLAHRFLRESAFNYLSQT